MSLAAFLFDSHITALCRRRTVRRRSRLSRQSGRQRREKVLCTLASVLSHQRVHDHQGGHSLDDGNSAGHNARVVAALGFQNTLLEAVGSGRLGLANGSRRLEGDAEVDRCPVGNTTLDTAGVICLGSEALAAVCGGDGEGVVVDGAWHLAAAEAGANLKTLGCGDAEHGVRQLGFEFVEAGLAQTDGHVANHAGDGSADAVVVVAEFLDDFGHARGGLGVGAPDWCILVHCLAVDGLQELEVFWVCGGGRVLGSWRVEVLVADGGDEGYDLNIVR